MKAYIFPGQGAQCSGMGLDLYNDFPLAKDLFAKANSILEFDITEIMFNGSPEDLKQTKVTQPAIFLHSVILSKTLGSNFKPDMVAGHSLGEFSALVANNTLGFEDALMLVSARAQAMQKACDNNPGTMAAVIGLENSVVENICKEIEGVVVAANYNCPGQLVISGEIKAIDLACEKLREQGARRALVLPVGGAFHSPLMEEAKQELENAINNTTFNKPLCPIYQNVTSFAVSDEIKIKENLIAQLTSPVKWAQSIQKMAADGATNFIELGPGKVLQGLTHKINSNVEASSLSS